MTNGQLIDLLSQWSRDRQVICRGFPVVQAYPNDLGDLKKLPNRDGSINIVYFTDEEHEILDTILGGDQ